MNERLDVGMTGAQGLMGPTGSQGHNGETGATGSQGFNGTIGETGPTRPRDSTERLAKPAHKEQPAHKDYLV